MFSGISNPGSETFPNSPRFHKDRGIHELEATNSQWTLMCPGVPEGAPGAKWWIFLWMFSWHILGCVGPSVHHTMYDTSVSLSSRKSEKKWGCKVGRHTLRKWPRRWRHNGELPLGHSCMPAAKAASALYYMSYLDQHNTWTFEGAEMCGALNTFRRSPQKQPFVASACKVQQSSCSCADVTAEFAPPSSEQASAGLSCIRSEATMRPDLS